MKTSICKGSKHIGGKSEKERKKNTKMEMKVEEKHKKWKIRRYEG